MEHDEQVKFVSLASLEVNRIHDPVCFLQKIQRLVVLLALYEGNCRVI